MAVSNILRHREQITKRNGFHTDFAKFLVLVVFTATTDAFKSIAFRPLRPQPSGLTKRLDILSVPLRKNSQTSTQTLRAAGTLEEYNVAQASNQKHELHSFFPAAKRENF
jgi:hypothetical protein